LQRLLPLGLTGASHLIAFFMVNFVRVFFVLELDFLNSN